MKFLRNILLFLILLSTMASADVFVFQSATDKVEIDEVFGNVVPVMKSSELGSMSSSNIVTNTGTTTANQYLRFGDATTSLTSPKVSYTKSDDGEVGSFIKVDIGTSSAGAFFEYELEFPQGLTSTISSSKNLEDIEDVKFKIFADEYTIIDTDIDKDTSKVRITLSTSAISHLAKEGEKAVYTIGPNKYEVMVDTISSSEARLTVNGQDIGSIEEDEVHFLSDDTVIGVRDIILSSGTASDIVDLFIGAKILEFEDHYNDETFEQGVTTNKEKISNAYVSIKGSVSGSSFKMTGIKYRGVSNTDLYIPEGERLSGQLSEELTLLGNWDILHDGFVDVSTAQILIDYPDTNYFQMTFQNNDGKTYRFPIYHRDGNVGDGIRTTYILEGSSSTDFDVAQKDYMVLSTGTTKNDKTYVLQYDSIDITNKIVSFNEMLSAGVNKITATYGASTVSNVTGEGEVTVGGNAFKFFIQNATTYRLAIDLNKDGSVAAASPDIITKGGGIIDVGTSQSPGSAYTLKLTTIASSFEEASVDEAITFQLSGGSAVGISSSSFSNLNIYGQGNAKTGMSDYGAEFVLETVNQNNLGTLEINYPLSQRFANIKIELLQSSSATATTEVFTTCLDGIQNGDETSIDCGGSCQPCVLAACSNGMQDSGEEGIDCGGSCPVQCTDEESGEADIIQDLTQGESDCSSGCLYVDEDDKIICLQVGERTKQLYCADVQELTTLKKNGQACQIDNECLSELCNNLVCGRNYNLVASSLNILLIILFILVIMRIHHALKS